MPPKRNKESDIFKQRQKEMRRKACPYSDSIRQINEELRLDLENSIQGMVNKILSNEDRGRPTVAPNSDTMLGVAGPSRDFLRATDDEGPSRDSSASDDEGPSRDSSASDD